VAKGARKRADALHVCYCHTPMRYVWGMYEQYFRAGWLGSAMRLAGSGVRNYLRNWDRRSADRPDYYIANSYNVKQRINDHYQRDSTVIYPPVELARWQNNPRREDDYFLVLSALVPYKRVDLAVRAFAGQKARLLIAGEGPEEQRLRRMASDNVEFLGRVTDQQRGELFAGARALVFPGEEDCGLVPVESAASGCPVIAYRAGGAKESISEGVNGTFFKRQEVASVGRALRRFAGMSFSEKRIRGSVAQFDKRLFLKEMRAFIEERV
jgi:glycosyltransferase involved in cell wall biosynthesis